MRWGADRGGDSDGSASWVTGLSRCASGAAGRGRRKLPWRCEVTVGGATRTLLEDRDDEGEGAATLGNSR